MSHTFDDAIVIPALRAELGVRLGSECDSNQGGVYYSAPDIELGSYDHVVLAMSGGKDAICALLRLIEMGVDLEKVELWHHDVDGREGSTLMDWHFMADYNRKLAAAFGVPIYFSWLQDGFEGELLKENSFSKPHLIETPDGLMTLERDLNRAKPGTRLRFPQQSASLLTRYCSSALKIDVGRRALNNQSRFDGKKVLFVTGERRQESPNRAKYNQLEPHACDRRAGRKARHVDAWRGVLHYSEEDVWATLERHHVIAPVPYRLGWSRSSCKNCIYNSPTIWATIRHYFPDRIEPIAAYEDRFGVTISRQRINVIDLSKKGSPMDIKDLVALDQASRTEYTLPVLNTESEAWILPAGAFGKEGCGSV